ncbi:SGNH/GDSL hydrolase family protein [Streptomyces sp. NPDC005125]
MLRKFLTRTAVTATSALALLAGGMSTAPGASAAAGSGSAQAYYLSLGDSLALGVQPTTSGQIRATSHGYVNVLHDTLVNTTDPSLQLTMLGCAFETTATLVQGGNCSYGKEASQLEAAESFLTNHRGEVRLITLNIGGNDIAGCASPPGIDGACVTAALTTLRTNLTHILTRLRAAAGPDVRIVGANSPDPFLVFWFQGAAGQQIAADSLVVTEQFNQVVSAALTGQGAVVADVATAFDTFATTPLVPLPGLGDAPLNVVRICQYTFMCAASPQGPDSHLTDEGYRVMAGAFANEV